MNTFQLTVSTPDGSAFRGEVTALFLRGASGDLAILAGHIPFVTAVRAGVCRFSLLDGTEKRGDMDGGLLTVSADGVRLLCGRFQPTTDEKE